ncbi:carbohydrate ABC transporter permease [Bifidobacterium platyrrhinorum]|uniref:ABC transporter permease subunit n=1 Tax=Bifidobacterium platyrrhinorum TaxID=2661628 RepID=A0A6L9SSL0_9BIFI|nr:sugar ABC transporter permease [Bifidobacterium platyrrhinorum]NEG55587.1 ABC transporter permease subunit [Bifidobacterium platyrrhinorum]
MSTASSTSGASHAGGSPVEQRALLKKNYPVKFVLPAAIILVIFFFVPTILNFVYAFTDWSAFKTTIDFNGLDNFTSLFSNGMLLRDLRITLVFAICVAFFQNTFGLALAVFLEKDTVENQIARVLFFIPVLMSALAVGYVWQAMLKSNGAVNQILSAIVGHTVATPWLGSTTWSIVLVSAIQGWKWAGLAMLIYLAGLKTIDQDVLEAAAIDGANRWQIFWKIKFPLLAPALTFNVATSLLGSMNGFDTVQATTQGGPGGSTEILNLFVWRTFGQGLYSQSTMMSLILFIVVMIIAIPLIWYLRRREAKIL